MEDVSERDEFLWLFVSLVECEVRQRELWSEQQAPISTTTSSNLYKNK